MMFYGSERVVARYAAQLGTVTVHVTSTGSIHRRPRLHLLSLCHPRLEIALRPSWRIWRHLASVYHVTYFIACTSVCHVGDIAGFHSLTT
jgi:hypothetical protein